MKSCFYALLVLFFAAGAAAAAGEGGRETTRYTLDNGLQVVLAPDDQVPKVVMNLRYRVGSMNEPAGRSGFAHLFEHLMFSGTEALPNISAAHSALGNSINAWTQEDGTVYYVEGLASGLPAILSMEADRMANLGDNVDQRELDLQREVVKNEMRQNVLDSAGAAGWTALWSGLFPDAHPYSRAIIGSIADLDAATLDDVRGFFNTYYVPNNAVLVLVGDFEVEDARRLVADTFGRIPRGADVPRPVPPAVAATKVRIEVTDRVATPSVAIGFAGPPASAQENGDLALAADLLGNGAYGLLRRRLVAEKGVASSVSASWTPGLLGGRFEIDATANAGVPVETLEKELRAAFDEFRATPVDPADVARAKSSSLLAARLVVEPYDDRASAIAYATDILGEPRLALEDDPQIVAATADSIAATVRRVLDPPAASTLIIRPGARGDYPPVLLESSGRPAPFEVSRRPGVDIPELRPREPGTTELPARETARLSNGIEVVHYQLADSPMQYVAAVSEAGWSNAPEGKEGLIDIAANMAVRGAGERDFASLAKAAADIGAGVGANAGVEGTAMSLSVPHDDFAAGLELLADVLLRPRFEADEWRILVADYEQWLVNREANLPGVAARAANRMLFPKRPGSPDHEWSLESLRGISLDDAKAAYRKTFQPSNTTFYSVGPQSIDEVVEGLEAVFADWKDDEPGFVADQFPSAQFPGGRKVLLVPEAGAAQSAIYVSRPAPGREEAQRPEATAVARLLGDDFESRLNSVIREEKGYSYGVSARLMSGMEKDGAMVVEMTVGRDQTGPALQEVFAGFGSLVTVPVTEQELNRTTMAYRTALAGTAETGGGFAGYVVETALVGVVLEEDHARRERVAALALEPVRDAARRLAALDSALVVIAGDPDVVLPQLEALDLGEVVVVERDPVEEALMRAVEESQAEGQEEPPAEPAIGAPTGAGPARTLGGCDRSTGRNCLPGDG